MFDMSNCSARFVLCLACLFFEHFVMVPFNLTLSALFAELCL